MGDLVARALDAYPDLVALAESVEDEWQYVTDLSGAWRARLAAVAGARADEAVPDGAPEAVEAAVAEIRLVTDPHRAIDWLSTFPQVVLAALGEPG